MLQILSKRLQNNSGAALVYVLITLVVVTIYIAMIGNLFQSNLKQVKAQEQSIKAYYLALSGTDLCMSSLLQHGTPQEVDDTLLYQNFRPSVITPETLTDDLTLEGGIVNLTVNAVVINEDRWIEIQSIATLDQTGATKKITIQFDYENPLIQKKF